MKKKGRKTKPWAWKKRKRRLKLKITSIPKEGKENTTFSHLWVESERGRGVLSP